MKIFHRFAPRRSAWWYAGIILSCCVAAAASAATKPAPAPSSSIFRICPDALDHSSSSIRSDDGRQTITVKLDCARCAIDFRLEGKPQFNDDFTDLVSLSPGGFMRLDVKDDGERRQLTIEPGHDGLSHTWKVNGHEAPYDDAARVWFAAFLVELDRRTAVGVDYRLPVLLRKGGVSAVLDETGRMPSDYVRSVYYSKLADATQLSSDDVVRVLDQATSLKTNDYYASELLKHFGTAAGDAKVRSAKLRMIQSMSSDYYRAESVKHIAGSGAEAQALIDAAATIESDYYRSESTAAILANPSLTEGDLLAIVKLTAPARSDYYRSEMLRRVLAHRAANEAVRRAVLDATDGMSSYYREEVERASARR